MSASEFSRFRFRTRTFTTSILSRQKKLFLGESSTRRSNFSAQKMRLFARRRATKNSSRKFFHNSEKITRRRNRLGKCRLFCDANFNGGTYSADRGIHSSIKKHRAAFVRAVFCKKLRGNQVFGKTRRGNFCPTPRKLRAAGIAWEDVDCFVKKFV